MTRIFDLVVRGGTVVNGTGAAPFAADVAVNGDRIVAVGRFEGVGREEIAAVGALVTPGFVDIHTHYDGQALWSERLIPSSQHGVTTVVMGNCGVGFAPCRAADRDVLVSLMEGVEDVPEIVMTAGLPWDWETFPEYLDALDRRPRDIDVAAYLPHSPLRVYAMGKRGADREPATDSDIARMRAIMKEALDAGALGFSTSRFNLHRTGDGENIPSFEAADREFFAIADVMKQEGKGIFQATLDGRDEAYAGELQFLFDIAKETERPVTFSLTQRKTMPDMWKTAIAMVERANAVSGVRLHPQVVTRPVGMIMGLETSVNPFSFCPGYVELQALPLAERVAHMRDRDVRARLLAETSNDPTMPIFQMARDFEATFALRSAADYEPLPSLSIAAMARTAGVTPGEIAYDLLLADDGHALLYSAMANYADGTLDATLELMKHEDSVIGLGDGGAHYGFVCDASYPTFLLTHWTRDRIGPRLSLPEAVRALSSWPASIVGLHDRGVIAPGYKADLNVIAYDALTLHVPHMVHDLPGGGGRLVQNADGYCATIVSGEVIARDGTPTGALPGRLVRGATAAAGQPCRDHN